jgi:peptidoglycan/LPS O-acetylase OafA/YrhL
MTLAAGHARTSGLDGLRVLAALLVVAFHMRWIDGVQFGPLDPIVRGGDTGIYLFFALSGYLLYRPFVVGSVELRSYGLKRAARILPGYFVALAGLTLITGNPLPVENPLPFLTMSASYDIPLRGFLGNAWTLSAEILFYVALPLLAVLARARGVHAIAGLAAASFSAALVLQATLSTSTEWLFGAFPFVFYAFAPGMLLAAYQVERPAAFARLAGSPALGLGIALIAVGAIAHTSPATALTSIGSALLIGWLLHHPLPGARLLAFGGGASYSLYLWHKDAFIAFGPALGLAVASVAAALSWLVVERPTLEVVHRVVSRRRTAKPIGEGLFEPTPVGTAP